MVRITLDEWVVKLDEKAHPRSMMVEVTTRCNFSCTHCFRFSLHGRLRLGDMSRATYRRVVDEASMIGIKRLIISGWGEPMVHPDILWMVEEAKSNGLEVNLNTNGYLIEGYADSLWKLGLDELTVSIDSPDPLLYEEIRSGGDLKSVSKGLERIKLLKLENLSAKPKVNIHFTLSSMNSHLVESMLGYASHIGACSLVVSNYIAINKEDEAFSLIGKLWDKELFVKLGYIAFNVNVNVIKPCMDVSTQVRCPFIESRALYVRWDGTIAPCINYAHPWTPTVKGIQRQIEPITFGDLKIDGLRSIWMNEDYAKFRFKVKTWRFPSCLDCDLRNYCSYTLTNESDCWGNTITCSHCPYARRITYCPV
ncbi:MAG: radical SAM protein [Candidatus Bathyarchaeia archaeon]